MHVIKQCGILLYAKTIFYQTCFTIYWKKEVKNVGTDKIKDIQCSSTFQIDSPYNLIDRWFSCENETFVYLKT